MEETTLDPIDLVNYYIWQTAIIPKECIDTNWCRRNIDPLVDDLQRVVEIAREEVDRTLLNNFSEESTKRAQANFRHHSRYPEGYCKDITDEVLSRLKEDPSDEPALRLIARADKENVLKRVFCIENGTSGKTFQNLVQIGDKLIDAAANTGENTSVQKVRIWPVENNPFKQIWFFEDYSSVKGRYHVQRIYSTWDNLPWLAPIMPAIAVNANNSIEFLDHSGLFFRNLFTDLRLSRRFLDSKLYEKEPLPKRVRDILRKTCKHGVFTYTDSHSLDREYVFDYHSRYWKDIFDEKIDIKQRHKKLDRGVELLEFMERLDHYSQIHFSS